MQREKLDHWGTIILQNCVLHLYHNELCTKIWPFFSFFIKVVANKSKAYSFLIIGMMHLKKYYFQLECCDSIFFSLLSRALEYMNTTEVLGKLSLLNSVYKYPVFSFRFNFTFPSHLHPLHFTLHTLGTLSPPPPPTHTSLPGDI